MKLRWYDRLLIALSGLVLIALGALGILFATGLLVRIFADAPTVDNWLGEGWKWTPLLIAVSAVLVLLGLWLLIRAFRRGENVGRYYTLQSEKDGNVRISVHAIDHLVHKSLSNYGQVVSAKVKIGGHEEAMDITLHVTLVSDVNIPSLIQEVREDIKRTLQTSAGVTVQTVQVYIDATKDEKNGDDMRYLEAQKPAAAKGDEVEEYINTPAFYTAPVVVTEDTRPETPIDAGEPTVAELKKEIDLGPDEPLPVNLSDHAFPFPEEEAGVPLQVYTQDLPIEDEEGKADE